MDPEVTIPTGVWSCPYYETSGVEAEDKVEVKVENPEKIVVNCVVREAII
jgi:hypothetical protein